MFNRKKYDDADLRYMQSLAAAVVQRSPRYIVLVILVMTLAIASAITWMSVSEIDIVVRGSGKVVPSKQLQVIQSLEGGVVAEILVREGELVEPLQPLIKISDIAFASSYEENRILYLELRARIARLRAEADDKPFETDELVQTDAPNVLQSERSLHESNHQQREETLRILEEQMRQNQNELLESQAKQRQLSKGLSLMRQELKLKEPLLKRRLVSEIEFLQLQQREVEMEGDLEAVRLAAPRIKSTIEEGRRKIEQSRLDFRNSAKRELNETTAEASRIAEAQEALRDRVQRTTLRSPVKGTVTRLHVNTLGGVVTPSTPIMEIVPNDGELLVEIRLKPSDIANISIGQFARLKFSAYDSAIFGTLDAEVVFLSADTVTNENGESHFVSRLEPARDYIEHQTSRLPIRVGMTAEADILTEKKTILAYLFKPIGRGMQRALSEQ